MASVKGFTSVIIPTKSRHDLLVPMVERLRSFWSPTALVSDTVKGDDGVELDVRTLAGVRQSREIIIVDDGDGESYRWAMGEVGCKALYGVFGSFAAAVNAGAGIARGSTLVILNNDLIPQNDLVDLLADDTRIVGAKLMWPNGLVQGYGIGLDVNCNPYPLYDLMPAQAPEVSRECSALAVSFAAVSIPASVFHQLGGLDVGLVNAYDDLDVCLRAREIGVPVLLRPVPVVHLGAQTQGRHDHDAEAWQAFGKKWIETGRIYRATGVYPFGQGA